MRALVSASWRTLLLTPQSVRLAPAERLVLSRSVSQYDPRRSFTFDSGATRNNLPVRRADNSNASARAASVSSRPSRRRQRQQCVPYIPFSPPLDPSFSSPARVSFPRAEAAGGRRRRPRRENDEYHDDSVDCCRRDDRRHDDDGERRRAQVRQCQADLRGAGLPAQRHPEGGDFM